MPTESRPRVLLVEDDDDNRELMAEVLESAGYEVVSASTGDEGLRQLAGAPMHAVVTDVGMPGMGGLELARKAKQIAPHVPIVVVTGYSEREDIARARGTVVDDVLVKPVDPEALTQAVDRLVRR
jgi:CheY-like chemotaxis protein